jgi:hypothetical protein
MVFNRLMENEDQPAGKSGRHSTVFWRRLWSLASSHHLCVFAPLLWEVRKESAVDGLHGLF